MKRIYKNSDIQFRLQDIDGLAQKFVIKFYTTNKQFFVRKTDEDVKTIIVTDSEGNDVEQKAIKLNWNELETIGDGVLNFAVNNLADDSDYDDGIYNNTFSKTTNYYINSNFSVEKEGERSISEIIAEINTKLDNEINRSTAKEKELTDAIASESDNRYAADVALQTNITSEVNRATTRENEIEAMFADYETISAHNSDVQTINTNINKKVDKTTYATDKAAIQSDIDTKANKTDVYTKTQIDAKETALNSAISNEATTREYAYNILQEQLFYLDTVKANVDVSYTKEESDAKYITEHQDISNLATKDELSTVQTNLQTSIDAVSDKIQVTGTENQIKVDENNKISFADDMIIDCGCYED